MTRAKSAFGVPGRMAAVREASNALRRAEGFLATSIMRNSLGRLRRCEIRALQSVRQIALACGGLEHDRAARERIDAVGERERLLDELLDQQHGGAGLAQSPHHDKNAVDEHWRETGGRLI